MGHKSESDREVSLKGNALRIYWYLLQRQQPTGIRDIQRALRLSTPSLVRHHLNRLEELGLAQQLEEGIIVARDVRIDALRSFVRFGHLRLPRQVFYLTFFAALSVYSALFAFRVPTADSILLLGALVFGVVSSAYEMWQTWRSAPW